MASKVKKLVFTALMAALTCVATLVIKVPTPSQGYIHLGDCIVLLCGWMLGPVYGACAASIGSALADVLSGYMIYVPATFVTKGLTAFIVWGIYRLLKERINRVLALCLSSVAAELFMVISYYLFEGVIYGFIPSLANVPANLIQALSGVILGVVLMKAMERHVPYNKGDR